MMYFTGEGGTNRYTAQDFEPSFKNSVGAAVREAWMESYFPVARDNFEVMTAGGVKLPLPEAQAYADSIGGFFKPDAEYSREQIDLLSERQRDIAKVQSIRERTPWDWGSPVRGLAMFGAGLADPLNLATAFVPWTRSVASLRALQATASKSASFGTRLGARVALGAADGGISTAVLEPLYFAGRQTLGDDYDAVDSLANIAFGTAFGGGVHAIGGIGSELYRRVRNRGAVERVADVNAGAVLGDEALPVGAVTRVAELPERLRQDIARSIVARDADGSLARAWGAVRTDEFSEANIQAALEANPMALTRTEPVALADIRNLDEAQQGETMTQGQMAESVPLLVVRTENGIEAINSTPAVAQAAASGDQSVQAVDVTDLIARGIDDLFAPREMTAADKAALADPQTREASLRAAVAQSIEGVNVEVEPIINGVDGQTMQADMQRSLAAENNRGADFDTSRAIDDESARAPKWQSLQDAEAEMTQAEAVLDDVIAMGDKAYKYSKSQSAKRGKALSADTLSQSVRQSFGQSTDSLLQTGQVQIVGAVSDLPNGPHPADVKAMTAPDGQVYIVAENVSEVEARGILLHEVGVHVGMRNMVGDGVFESILTQLDEAIVRGESWAQAARSAVPADTNALHVREEQLAYLVENAPELGIVQQLIAAVRAWAFRTFQFARDSLTLTEADFRAMAVSALHDVGRRGERSAELAEAFSRNVAQTETKAFRDWFGDSKVVDGQGKPLVVYHGSPDARFINDDGTFKSEKARYGFGRDEGAYWFAADRSVAKSYADPRRAFDYQAAEPGIIEAFVKLENPLIIDGGGRNWREAQRGKTSDVIREARDGGFDGVIIKNVKDNYQSGVVKGDRPTDTYVVFQSTQIKSAIGNRGTFDPTNPDIRYSRGATQDPSTAKDELKPFDEQLARAKSVAAALRAAADKLENNAQAVAAMKAEFPDISTEEAEDLLNELRRQVQGMRGAVRSMREMTRAEDAAAQMQTAAMQAADTMANNIEMAAVIERRNAVLNLNARLKAQTFLQQFNKPGLDVEGFFALLVGSERLRTGSRVSIDAEYKGFRSEWQGGMLADLQASGLHKEFVRGTFDRDIYDALYKMGEGQSLSGIPKEAVKLAEIVSKYQESARNTRNRFGAWIRDLKGYITRQSHDMFKIRDAGEYAWIQTTLPRLDMPKMRSLGLIGADVMGSMRQLYADFASGVHTKAQASDEDLTAFSAGSNLARRESVSRALYFKDGIAAFEYNAQFGAGSGRLAESVLMGLDSAARSAALLKTLGTNPEAMLTKLLDDYEQGLIAEPQRRQEFRAKREAILNRLRYVDGTTNIPGNVTAAKWGAGLRSLQSMAKLGGALISSFTDLANYGADIRFGQGKNMLEGTLDGVLALTQRTKGKKRAILDSLGVFHESTLGAVMSRFDSPELIGGKMSAAMNLFFKFNGLTWWTESLRDGAALSYSNFVAGHRNDSFADLPDELKRMFELYNVDEGKWNLWRKSVDTDEEGRFYLTPEALRTIPRSEYAKYIESVGRTVNDASIQNLQDDLAQAMRVMFIDRAHHAVVEPNARVRAWMTQGTRPGTFGGEMVRYIGQFKSFSVAMVQMVLGREIYGRGYDNLGDYWKNGKGDMVGLATYIALATGFGYMAMAVKDMIKGREPRNPADPKTFIAAMAQGGGLGLYGDFLFGEYNRFGRSLTSSLAGPVLGQADTAADLWTRIKNGDDLAAASFKALLDNTPFANLFYLRVAFDYLFLYGIHEAMNPGFLRRMERRIERENNQEFLFPPSQYANQF